MQVNKTLVVEGSYKHELSVPCSWEFAEFKNVIELIGGSQPPKSSFVYECSEGLIRLIQIRDYKSDKNLVYIPIESARRFVEPDEVMIGRYGPPIFQILRGLKGAYNVALMKASPICGSFSNDYLYRYLSNQNLYNYVNSASDRTAGQSGVNRKHLEKYPVGVPPLAEQREISKRLDTLLAQVDAIKTRLDAIPAILKRFRQSTLTAATSGRLTQQWRGGCELIGWKSKTVIDVVEYKPRNGRSPKGVDYKTPFKNLTLSATTRGYFIEGCFKYIDIDIDDDSHLWVLPGDILIQRANSLDYVGVSAIYRGAEKKYVYPDLMMKCRPNESIIGDYLHYCLLSQDVRKHFRDNATGTAGNMPKINQTTVCSAPIKLPPKHEQVEIVRRVEELFAFADQVEQRVKEAQRNVNNLTQSILAKAFRGELTADWRTANPDLITGENSATALLARIQSERALLTPKKKTRKKKKS